jgi:hypothetical protein
MKRSTFTILLVSLFLIKAIAQQVEQSQHLLLTERTASWCPNCGTWGWALKEGLLEDNANKIVFFAAHYDGVLATMPSEDITSNFGGFSQPRFYLNHTDLNANSSNGANVRNTVKAQVEAALTAMPVANVGFDANFANGTYTVNAKVKFFQAASGEFYLGMYLIENNVTAYQASIGNNANHTAVLQESFTTSSFGNQITNGDVSAGSEFQMSFSLPLVTVTGHDYEVVGVIWQKVNGKYQVVNVWKPGLVGNPSSIIEPQTIGSLSVMPTVATAQTTVAFGLNAYAPSISLDLIDLNGRVVLPVFSGSLPQGNHQFTILRERLEATGVYFVRLTSGQEIVTRKVVFN